MSVPILKYFTKKRIINFIKGFGAAVSILTPFIFYWFISGKPFKKINFSIDVYTINSTFNSYNIYKDRKLHTSATNVLTRYFDYKKSANYRRGQLWPYGLNPDSVYIENSTENDSTVTFMNITNELIDSLTSSMVRELKQGQYELKVVISNTSRTTFKNPVLEVNSDFLYSMIEKGDNAQDQEVGFKKITNKKINLGEYLRPKQSFEISILTNDNTRAEVEDGAIVVYSAFPDIYLSVDDELISPIYSERIIYKSNLDSKLTHFVINNVIVQVLIFGFTILGIFFLLKSIYWRLRPKSKARQIRNRRN